MKDIKRLIPKNKFDDTGIKELQKLSFEQIEPIIPDLLEWLQDMNWPVSRPVVDILISFADRITPELIKILKTDDVMWKYWILIQFGEQIKDPLFFAEVERIAKYPTLGEIENEVNLEAIAILNGDYK